MERNFEVQIESVFFPPNVNVMALRAHIEQLNSLTFNHCENTLHYSLSFMLLLKSSMLGKLEKKERINLHTLLVVKNLHMNELAADMS